MDNRIEPLFSLGRIVATPGALEDLEEAHESLFFYLNRHVRGDWGDLEEEDKEENHLALRTGDRILSAYQLPTGKRLWIITTGTDDAGNRESTCALRPEDY